MIIDTHCHYNIQPLLTNVNEHWKNSITHKVVGGICVGTNLTNSKIALNLAQKFPSMFVSIGIHPEEFAQKVDIILENNTDSEELVESMITENVEHFKLMLTENSTQSNSKLIAVGEIGLDYYRLKVKGLKREIVELIQKHIFTHQLELAFQFNLPVILHVRDQVDRHETNAYYDTFDIVNDLVQKYSQLQKITPSLILHCASGPKDYIQKFLDLGAYIGFAGNITYSNAKELLEIFSMTPGDRILLETDAPFLVPGEHKNQICEPYFITHTANFLQDKYQLKLDIILSNTLKVFPAFQKFIE